MALSWMPKRDLVLKSLWDIEKDTYPDDAWWKPSPPPKVAAPTSLQELMNRQPEHPAGIDWGAMWKELPINPYYWKTPQEKADIENRTIFAEWARNVKKQTPEIAQRLGISDPDAYADKMMADFNKRSGTEVAMRANGGEGAGISLPTTVSTASFTPQQGETAAERFIMDWVAPLGIGGFPFGARVAKPIGEAVVKGTQELAAAAKPTLRELATSEVGAIGKGMTATMRNNLKKLGLVDAEIDSMSTSQASKALLGEIEPDVLRVELAKAAKPEVPKPKPEVPAVPVKPTSLDFGGRVTPGWARTQEDIVAQAELGAKALGRSKESLRKSAIKVHKEEIAQALAEGKPVPPEVLKNYPDLIKGAPAPEVIPKTIAPVAKVKPPVKPPIEPPIPGLTPEEEASRLKFKDFVVQIRSEKPTVAQAIKAGTRTKMGTLEGVYAKPQGRQTFLKAGVALKGQMKPDVIPPQMTETDINNLFNMAAKAKLASGTGKVNRGVTYDLQDALNKMFGLDPANPGKYVRPQPHQIDLMAKVYGDDVGKALMNARSWSDKAFDRLMSVSNIPRVMQTTVDHSTVLRQNFILTASHPVKAARNVVESMKSLKSPEIAEASMKIRRESRFYDDAINKLGIEDIPMGEEKAFAPLSAMEESFQTRVTITKNKTLRALLTPARLSERIYTLYGNLQRLDVAYGVMENMEKAGLYADWIASGRATNFGQLINWASGRGSLPKFMSGKGAVVMNSILYSPRLIASRVEYPFKAAQTIFSKSTPAPIRKEAIRQVVATVGAGASILALIKQSGVADVELDPRSSDFGKIRIGNTRIDYWGGFIQYARFFAQLAKNERKVVGSGEITGLNRLRTSEYFVRGKLAPAPALVIDLLAGQTYMGEEFKATPEFTKEQVEQRLVPLFMQDCLDAIRTEGWVGGFVALPGFFGVGITSYKPDQPTNYFPVPSKKTKKSLPLP